jgi:hypothetical protein
VSDADHGAGRPPATPRASKLADVSLQLAELIDTLRHSREARCPHPAVTPLPGPALTPAPAPAAGGAGGPAELERLRAELARTREAEAELRERLHEARRTNRAAGDELVGLQACIGQAAAAATALRRLHEAPSRPEVLDALADAIVNLVGCEDFAVWLDGPDGPAPARAMGPSAARAEALAADPGLRAAAAAGEILTGPPAAALGLTALLPLAARGEVVGAAALVRLLPQKGALGEDDAEVLEILRLHGALALRAAPGGALDAR